MDPATIATGLKIVSGVFGLFKKKKKKKVVTPRDNMLSQAAGAREASDKYGFNPLTMLQYGQTGASTGLIGDGAPPPLTSLQTLTEGLDGLDDILSGAKARRAAADQLEIDLARLKMDQARSGVVLQAPAPRADTVGTGPSVLGRRAVTVPNGGAVHSIPRPSLAAGAAGAAIAGAGGLSAPPPQHPRTRANEMVPVTWTDGKASYIPRGVANRLDLKPFDSVVAGDLEEMRGEWVGGVENSVRAPDVVRYQGTGTPLGQLPYERPVLEVDGDKTADIYDKIFGADHSATKKAKTKKPKRKEEQ